MQKEKTKEIRKHRHTSSLQYRKSTVRKRIKKHKTRNIRNKRESSTNEYFLTTNNITEIASLKINDSICNEVATDIIRDVYPIIKDEISIFICPDFSLDTEPLEFLEWMMNCYSELYVDEFWEIILHDKFHLKRVYDYDIEMTGYSSELKFLEKVEDKKLYNLFIIAFSLLRKKGVPFWIDSYNYEMALDMIENEISDYEVEDSGNDHLISLKESLKEKDIHDVLMSKINSQNTTLKELKEFYWNYSIGKNNKILDTFFKLLFEFVSIDDYIGNYIYITFKEEENSNPITPMDYAVIGYNYNTEDSLLIFNESEYTEMNYNEYGIVPFRSVIDNDDYSDITNYPHLYIALLESITQVESTFN